MNLLMAEKLFFNPNALSILIILIALGLFLLQTPTFGLNYLKNLLKCVQKLQFNM